MYRCKEIEVVAVRIVSIDRHFWEDRLGRCGATKGGRPA